MSKRKLRKRIKKLESILIADSVTLTDPNNTLVKFRFRVEDEILKTEKLIITPETTQTIELDTVSQI